MSFGLMYAGVVAASLGQLLGLDCFITSLANGMETEPPIYWILWICSMLFNVVFWPIVFCRYGKTITKEMRAATATKKIHLSLVIIGLCDAVNGLLVVYASNPKNVSHEYVKILDINISQT